MAQVRGEHDSDKIMTVKTGEVSVFALDRAGRREPCRKHTAAYDPAGYRTKTRN